MANLGASVSPDTGALTWDFAALTDPGRVRANNEDTIAFDPALGLVLLADGMGGYNGGEVASGMAVALLQASFGRWLAHAGPNANPRAVRRALQAGTDEANAAVLEAGVANLQLQGMGTTLVLAAFGPRRAIVGHIGDSRCYRLRNNQLEQITKDHSLLQEQMDAGLITPEQAATSTNKNLVTRALGVEDAVLLEVNEYKVEPGDLYLMCSDGLSDMLDDEAIAHIVAGEASLEQKSVQLIDAANANGGRDNISVLLALATSGSRKRGLISRWLGQ
jgi:protein phosphatase